MRSETHDPLLRALRLLELRPRRVLTAVAAGVATLGSALALAALSAWLITRAWEMPPVLDPQCCGSLPYAHWGISRGVFRYPRTIDDARRRVARNHRGAIEDLPAVGRRRSRGSSRTTTR